MNMVILKILHEFQMLKIYTSGNYAQNWNTKIYNFQFLASVSLSGAEGKEESKLLPRMFCLYV
jgi:hypothetical protein